MQFSFISWAVAGIDFSPWRAHCFFVSTPRKEDTDKLFDGLHPQIIALHKEARKRLRNRDRKAWSNDNLKPTTTTEYGKNPNSSH